MKKNICVKIVIAFTIVITGCASRKAEPIKGKSFVTANEGVANGEKVFMANCQKCHPGGEAGLGLAINPTPVPQFIKRFQMRHGIGVMPSFKKDEISTKDLKDISRYLCALNKY